jgi:hypothetical protein
MIEPTSHSASRALEGVRPPAPSSPRRRRETNLIAFHVGHETAVDVVVMAFVPTLATVSLSQFDAVFFKGCIKTIWLATCRSRVDLKC